MSFIKKFMLRTILLLLFFIPTFAFSQVKSTLLAYQPTPAPQKINWHFYSVTSEADDIKRAKKAIVFGTVLNVTGAALAILAPKLSEDDQRVRTYQYVGLGVGVTGFAFSIPAIFVLTKNRNRFY